MKKVRLLLLVLLSASGPLTSIPSLGQWSSINHTAGSQLFLDVFFLDEDKGYILGLSGQTFSNFVLKTFDGGLHLDPGPEGMTAKNPLSLFFTNEMKGYIASQDKICRTTDGGLTWSETSLGLGQNVYVGNLCFFDENVGYASAMDIIKSETYMIYTRDAGENWSVVQGGPSAESGSKAISCIDANTCYATGPYGDKGVFKSSDGGKSWTKIFVLSEVNFNSVHFTDSGHGVIVGGSQQYQKIYRTIDGGKNWEKVYDAPGNQLMSVGFTNAQHGFAVGNGGTIVATIDGGETWLPQESPTDKTLYSIHCPDENTAYAVGAGGTLLKYRSSTGNSKTELHPEEIQVYFNSTSNQVIFELNSEQVSDQMKLVFFDCLGKKILEIEVNTHLGIVPKSLLGSGIFFYQLTDRNSIREQGKILIY